MASATLGGSAPPSTINPDGVAGDRDGALLRVVESIAAAGDPVHGDPLIDQITHPLTLATAMTRLAGAHARAGNQHRARRLLAAAWTWGEWTTPLSGLVDLAPDLVVELLTDPAAPA